MNARSDILNSIIQNKKHEMQHKKYSISALGKMIFNAEKCRSFCDALCNKDTINIIAEIKKASPSAGLIREDLDHIDIGKQYCDAGATCISILTDERYFQGKIGYVQEVKNQIDVPVLRKDFIIDPYQVVESRAFGADCILLIVAILDEKQLQELEEAAIHYGLDVLVEVHNEYELERAMILKTKLIGVNNRNLKTMKTHLETSIRLKKSIPDEYTVVCESGIKTRDDIAKMMQHGMNSFLVGESLMRHKNPGDALKKLTQLEIL